MASGTAYPLKRLLHGFMKNLKRKRQKTVSLASLKKC